MEKQSQRFSYKNGYNYIKHWEHDCMCLSNKFLAVNKIGNELINKINSTNNLDNIWNLNSELSYLSSLLLPSIEIFCGCWNELFYKTFRLKFNNNPFLFVNNIFILSKHKEREINDFYHGYFKIADNIDKEESEKMQKLFNSMHIKNGNPNIYNIMRALKHYSYISKKAYFNKCKKWHDENWALKDFKDISIDEFLDKKQVFLPQFNSYLNVIFQINESFLENDDNKNKQNRHQEILKFTKQILAELIKKFTMKKIFKLFIIDEWNKYIDALQNLMYFFNVFMYENIHDSNINNFDLFKNTNFAKKTNWYEQYNINKNYWINRSNKLKLPKLTKLKQNNKTM